MDNTEFTTPLALQRALCKEIEEITKDMPFKRFGEQGEGFRIKAYPQDLPVPEKRGDGEFEDESTDETGIFAFPFTVVKLDTGKTGTTDTGNRQTVNIVVVAGIFDDNPKREGHKGVMNVIERIIERFSKNPLLAGKFTVKELERDVMFRWSLQDEDTYPYYYGALEMSFSMKCFEREDKYA